MNNPPLTSAEGGALVTLFLPDLVYPVLDIDSVEDAFRFEAADKRRAQAQVALFGFALNGGPPSRFSNGWAASEIHPAKPLGRLNESGFAEGLV